MTDKPEAVALKPCPLCGDPMLEDGAAIFGHLDLTNGCLLASLRWHAGERFVAAWNTRAQPDASALVEAVRQSQKVFAEYAELHRAKLGPLAMTHGAHSPEFFDVQIKVDRNENMADLCLAALTAWEAQHGSL